MPEVKNEELNSLTTIMNTTRVIIVKSPKMISPGIYDCRGCDHIGFDIQKNTKLEDAVRNAAALLDAPSAPYKDF